jgi:hypothetical protein
MMRKIGITPVSVFRVYYKSTSKYKPKDYSIYVAYKTKKIGDKAIEKQIEHFLEKNRYEIFNNSLSKIENYFDFCFSNNKELYFYNLSEYIKDWQQYNLEGQLYEQEIKFADEVFQYLLTFNLTFETYITCNKNKLPVIIQHYISTRKIPFELLLYLNILEDCKYNKKRLKVLLAREYVDMKKHKSNLKKLEPLLKEELEILLTKCTNINLNE